MDRNALIELLDDEQATTDKKLSALHEARGFQTPEFTLQITGGHTYVCQAVLHFDDATGVVRVRSGKKLVAMNASSVMDIRVVRG